MSEEPKPKSMLTRRGLFGVGALGLSVAAGAGGLMEAYSTTLDSNLGTTSQVFSAESTDDEPLYQAYVPTDDVLNEDGSGNSTALIQKAIDLGHKEAVEGTVLLKNEGGLPLSSGAGVTLLGARSYTTLLGSGMGTKVTGPYISLMQALGDATSTDFANTIATGCSMTTQTNDDGTTSVIFSEPSGTISGWSGDEFAIEGAGLSLNTAFQDAYASLNTANGLSNNDIGTPSYNPFEPSVDDISGIVGDVDSAFDGYDDAIIVTLGRPSAESYDYQPGSVVEGTGQTEPLELSDNERAIIELAKEHSDNVIVIVNTSNAMEIRDLADDDAIKAIIDVGFIGAYGALGVADIIVGKENPSGGLADTFPTYNMSAPAMQNMGDFTYTNVDEWRTRPNGIFGDTVSKYIVECEGIYVGYKYYETRYYDAVLGQGNATGSAGCYASSGSWDYDAEVTYSFGYGLSYTDFDLAFASEPTLSVSTNAKGATIATLSVDVTVTNTGDVAGKKNVQVYGQAPYTQGGVEKSAVILLDFGKTDVIEPGASETVTVDCDLQFMASYDNTYANADGTTGTYVLDPGTYYFAVGNGAHDALNNIMAAQGIDASSLVGDSDASLAYALEITEDVLPETAFSISKAGVQVSNQLEYSDWNYFQPGEVTQLSRADWNGTFPVTYDSMTPTDEQLISYLNGNYYDLATDDDTSDILWEQDSDVMFWDLAGLPYDDPLWDEAVNKMSLDEAVNLATWGGPVIPGVDSLGTYEATLAENMGIGFSPALNSSVDASSPWIVSSDDPNGVWTGSVLGGATLLASTFNHDVMYEAGQFVGIESLFMGYPLLWGPGLNTHRHAYNGRSGEYYSEDAILTGTVGMEFAIGAQDFGLIAAPKHFAFNDQETNRAGIAPYMTEQKARECDLRAFQIAFEAAKYDTDEVDAAMKGTMTSFSKIGPVECTCSTGLLTGILKGEWNCHGYFVTDIYDDTDLYACVLNSGATCYDTRGYSGFDGVTTTIEGTYIFQNQNNGVTAGITTVQGDANLQQHVKDSAHNILFALANSNLVNRYNSTTTMKSQMTWWRGAYMGAAAAFGVLAVGAAASAVKAGMKKEEE